MRLKILIIKLSALGDVVHALPALRALRTKFPDDRIDWLVEEAASSILLNHPMLNNVHIFKKAWRKKIFRHLFSDIIPFYKSLQKEKFDWAIDLQGLTKSGVAAYFSGAENTVGFGDKDGRELNKLFTSVKIFPPDGLHVVERNLRLLTPLGIVNPEVSFPLPVFEKNAEITLNGEYILVNPGAGWVNKKLPQDILGEACARISKETELEIVAAWGPGEESIAENLVEIIKGRGGRARIAPRTNIPQLVSMISRCRLYLGGDTGPTHLAAALNAPVVSWFGPSDSRRNGPYGSRCAVIQKFALPCVPCWKTDCPFSDKRRLQCLETITADELYQEARKHLEKKKI